MRAVLDRMAARVRTMVTRGRVTSTTLNPKRPLVQLSGLAGEVKTKIELFVPMGMSVYPTGNEDVLLLQIDGSRSHLVAMFADNPALRIRDLQPGEFGHRDANGQQIVFRQDKLEITSPLKMVVNITGDADITVGGNVNLNASGQVNVNAGGKFSGSALEWDLTGNLHVTGNISASGHIG